MTKFDLIYGFHSSVSALNNKKRTIYYCKCTKEVLEKLKTKLNDSKIAKCKVVDRRILDNEAQNKLHQGILVKASKLKEEDIDSALIENSSTILILDSLTDSQNVGAIIRSAFLFGIKLIFYNDNNSFNINTTMIKAASGAFEYVKMIKIVNINNLIQKLKLNDYWILGLDSKGKDKILNIPKNINKVIILGSEGKGIRSLIKKNCDYLITIPMTNNDVFVDSLNVSNAASIIFYELNTKNEDKS